MAFLYFIIALGILIFIHELGHFIMAKRSGVRVETFSIGFGPRLLGFQYGETLYQISAIPFGGYVKLTGEDPNSEDASHPNSFAGKSLGKRFRVVFAGPAMNLLLAAVVMPIVFMLGRPIPAYLDKAPIVEAVMPDSPAAEAGMEPGDKILTLDGVNIDRWETLLRTVMLRPDSRVKITWERAEQVMVKEIAIRTQGKGQSGYLGVEPAFVSGADPIIDEVQADSPAGKAGLKPGDRVIAIDGDEINTWAMMSELVQTSDGAALTLKVERDGKTIAIKVKPKWNKKLERYLLGVRKLGDRLRGDVVVRRYPFVEAFRYGTMENLRMAGLTFQVLGRLLTFQLSYKNLGGPVRIAQMSAMAAKSGAADFLYFLAFLSLQLGILNLLPIPVLDGGHILFMALELVFRRPVSRRIQGVATQLGLFFLLFVMLIVTVNDIDIIWGFRHLLEKVQSLF